MHNIPYILEKYGTSVSKLEEVHRKMLWTYAAKGSQSITEFDDGVAMEPVHSTSARGSADGYAATEEDSNSDDDEQEAAALHAERQTVKEEIKGIVEQTGADITTRVPVRGDYAIEIREELARRKNRSYDTYDSLNRRIRVKFKPPDTWIKVTQHNYDHMKTAYARDDNGWHVVETRTLKSSRSRSYPWK